MNRYEEALISAFEKEVVARYQHVTETTLRKYSGDLQREVASTDFSFQAREDSRYLVVDYKGERVMTIYQDLKTGLPTADLLSDELHFTVYTEMLSLFIL